MKKSHLLGFLFLFVFCLLEATAVAQSAQTCVKPFTIPDRWIENSFPPNDTFTTKDKNGTLLTDRDGYYPGPGGTGYNPVLDKGLQLVLNASEGNSIDANSYYPLTLPDSVGGNDYRSNISGCSPVTISLGDLVPAEPGNKTGSTIQGVKELINKDPGAYWNTATNSVASIFPVSPRIMVTLLFDPADYEAEKLMGRNTEFKVANIIGFFVEAVTKDGIFVRITPLAGSAVCGDGTCDSQGGEDCHTCAADCPAPPNTVCL